MAFLDKQRQKQNHIPDCLHLIAEGVTMLALILSGIGLPGKRTWGRNTAIIALGILLYTTLVTPGNIAQQG